MSTLRRPVDALADAALAPRQATRLEAILAGKSHITYREIEIPLLGAAKVRLLSRAEMAEIDLAVARWLHTMTLEGINETTLGAAGNLPISTERGVRIAAAAVRDPDDPAKPFGSLEQWRQLADVQIGAAIDAYEDLVEELDPLGPHGRLTDADAAEILDALSKKNIGLLTSFGSRRLARFLCTTGEPPAS